jgi:hypothetical protein
MGGSSNGRKAGMSIVRKESVSITAGTKRAWVEYLAPEFYVDRSADKPDSAWIRYAIQLKKTGLWAGVHIRDNIRWGDNDIPEEIEFLYPTWEAALFAAEMLKKQ